MKITIFIVALFLVNTLYSQELRVEFEIYQSYWDKDVSPKNGRLFLLFSKEKPKEVFRGIPYPDLKMDPVFSIDVFEWVANSNLHIKGEECYGFPINHMADIPERDWYVYAVFKSSTKNLAQIKDEMIYSDPILITINQTHELQRIKLITYRILENTYVGAQSGYFAKFLLYRGGKSISCLNCNRRIWNAVL